MNQQKLNYIHYYLLAIVTSILVWGAFEYITICNGQNCMIDTNRLWKGLSIITLIFIPITLCIWSTHANSVIRFLLNNLKTQIKIQYEEKTLLFAILIFVAIFAASLAVFNIYWNYYVGDDVIKEGKNFSKYGKEYMAATANVAVFVATLFAPIAALILYDNWKVQYNKNIEKEYIKIILENLRKITKEHEDMKLNLSSFYNHNVDCYDDSEDCPTLETESASILKEMDIILLGLFFEYCLIEKDLKLQELFITYRITTYHLIHILERIDLLKNNTHISFFDKMYEIMFILNKKERVVFEVNEESKSFFFIGHEIGEISYNSFRNLYEYILKNKVKL